MRIEINAERRGEIPAMKGSERMNVTNYFEKHGYIFGLEISDKIYVVIFDDIDTAIKWSASGKTLCSKSVAVLYSSEKHVRNLLNTVKTQNGV